MKTILWESDRLQATKALKNYLDELVQKYDIVTIVPTYYIGPAPVIQSAIIVVKNKK